MTHAHRLLLITAIAASLMLSGCNKPKGQTITLTGSSTIAPVAAELGKAFEARHPSLRVNVQTGGSSRGLADTKAGLADIGMVSRQINDVDESVTSHLLARDGLAIIVHSSNTVAELSASQIVDFYRGIKSHWADGTSVSVVHKADGRSTQQVFLKHFKLATQEVKADAIVGDNEQGIKTVAANPTAIGYVSIGAAQYAASHGAPIRLLPLNGIEPTVENVANGRYPLARELNFVTGLQPSAATKTFLQFSQSSTAAKIIESLFFVPAAKHHIVSH